MPASHSNTLTSTKTVSALAIVACLSAAHVTGFVQSRSIRSPVTFVPSASSERLGQLSMQPNAFEESARRPSDLSAFTAVDGSSDISIMMDDAASSRSSSIPDSTFFEEALLPVLSSSLLITGNTVGAGMLVLPELAAGPGMMVSTGVLLASYVLNLVSGLAIAEVAINQKESSGSDVPSSFKEFAETNLNGAFAGNLVAAISVFSNALVLAFDSTKAGQVLSTLMGGIADSSTLSLMWGALFVGLVTTQSRQSLSQVASILVMGLFSTFAALLLPGLAHVADPLQVITSTAPTSSEDVVSQVLHIMPVFITTLVYQNIVPTVTRILDYDRVKTTAAVVLGSSIPLAMYLSWCVAVLGGGIDTASFLGGGASSVFMTIFTMATVGGSSLGALTSLSEEFGIVLSGLLGNDNNNDISKNSVDMENGEETSEQTFPLPAVVLPVAISLMLGEYFSADITGALKVAGSFGSPLLYGAIPVAMAMIQRQASSQQETTKDASSSTKSNSPKHIGVVPGGMASLGALGVAATAFVGSEFVETFLAGAAV